MKKSKQAHFGADDLENLKEAYAECKGDSFIYQGIELYKGYAKYLIEYLEHELKEAESNGKNR